MSDWNSLTNDDKRERLGNLQYGKVYSFRYKPNNTLYRGKFLTDRIKDQNGKDAIRIKYSNEWAARGRPEVLPLEDLDVGASPFVQPQRAREMEAYEFADAEAEARARAPRLAALLDAAEPGKSVGYIDSQLRERYYRDDRVIVLFSGDDPPIWYKGTILHIDPKNPSKRYYVVFDDGDERWIEYKNNNIRYFANAVEVGLEQKQQQRGRGRRKTRKKRRKRKSMRKKTKKRRR